MLLSLLPPSCMVVPIRALVNITLSTTTKALSTNILNMFANEDVVMDGGLFDCLFKDICDNYNEVQGHTLAYSAHCPRTPSMSSSECKESYAKQIERQNDIIVEEDLIIKTNCVSFLDTQIELEYVVPKS